MPNYYDKRIEHEGPLDAKILLVGEAGGETEMSEGRPFVGESGSLLMSVLTRAGISRDEIRLANLSHYRPNNNKFEYLLDTDILREGLRELYTYIQEYKPTVIGALGAWPLYFLTGRKGIKKWRGSILSYKGDESIKVIATLHPAAVLRDRSLYPIFDCDIKRIVTDAGFREKRLPVRQYICDPRGLELEEWTQRLCAAEYLGTDIESIKGSTRILCVGFAPSPEVGVCISTDHEEGRRAIQRILLSSARKIFQFGTYDTIQLIHENGYQIYDPSQDQGRPYFWDTLVAQHVLAPELPRSLEYLTSVYTREPYYKTVGRGSIPDDEKGWSEKVEKQTLWEYNAKDCCCTIEIALQQLSELSRESQGVQNIFAFEMASLCTQRHISCAGMAVDEHRRSVIENVLMNKWVKKQFVLDRLTGFETNVRSPKLKKILYDELQLPSRRNRDGTVTTDEDAIVSLITYCKDHIANLRAPKAILDWKVKLAVCQTILEIRGIRQVLSVYIRAKNKKSSRISSDGRLRSTYRVGPETGRWSSSKYVDGTGVNAQTIPRDPVEIDESELTLPATPAILEAELDNEPDEDDNEEAA